jgi:8-oxo-dGTP diphosphatase
MTRPSRQSRPALTELPRHSVSVAGVVVDDANRVLVIQRRDNGRWEPPGGVLELGEDIEAGVRREVLEETGVEVEVQRLTGVYKNMSRGVVALVFRCRPLSHPVASSAEAAVVGWIAPVVVDRLMAPSFAVRVTDALGSQSPAIRAHDGVSLIASRPEL